MIIYKNLILKLDVIKETDIKVVQYEKITDAALI